MYLKDTKHFQIFKLFRLFSVMYVGIYFKYIRFEYKKGYKHRMENHSQKLSGVP